MWDEVDGQGLEALITKVERCLEQNKLLEAADLLEARLKGTEAEHVATEWVHKARNRAVTEQALLMVQSHAIALACAEAGVWLAEYTVYCFYFTKDLCRCKWVDEN